MTILKGVLKALRFLAGFVVLFALLVPSTLLYRVFPFKPIDWLDNKILALCDYLVPLKSAIIAEEDDTP